MGSARAPVVGSGAAPAWICRVSKLQPFGSLMRQYLLGSPEHPRRGGLRPLPDGGRRPTSSSPGSTSDGVEVAGQQARCFTLPLVSRSDLRTAPARPRNDPDGDQPASVAMAALIWSIDSAVVASPTGSSTRCTAGSAVGVA